MTYIGRFAPSPTGPLHFGSLLAATASYLDAKSQQGQWLLRIDDLDTARVIPHSIDTILHQLDAFGFHWDQSPFYQSDRSDLYQSALDQLLANDQAYYCQCSRKQIFERQPGGVYDGFCRNAMLDGKGNYSVRFKTPDKTLCFIDLIQGEMRLSTKKDLGDFVLKRSDAVCGYQLACAADELDLGITHVIRGADLMSSCFAQSLITEALDNKILNYGHHPVAVTQQNIKYSKSANSPAIDVKNPTAQLWQALNFLAQSPPLELQYTDLETLWDWALNHWQRASIPKIGAIKL